MKHLKYLFSFCLFIFLISSHTYAQIITWTGNGDGKNWEDAQNWDANTLPNPNDIVLINNGNTVQTNQFGAVAKSIAIGQNSTLNLAAGDLTIDNQNTTHGLILFKTGTLIIQKDVILNIINTNENAIFIDEEVGTINNHGIIKTKGIGTPTSDGFIIRVGANSLLNFTNQLTGNLLNDDLVSADFLLVPANAKDHSSFINYGLIDLSQLFQDGFHLFTQMKLDNHGIINIDSIGKNGFFLDAGVELINHPSGILNLTDIGGKGILLNGTSSFINEGKINIQQQEGGNFRSHEGIHLASSFSQFINSDTILIIGIENAAAITLSGNFSNNGLLNVGVGITGKEAINLSSTGTLSNAACGIINITTPNQLANNQGIINNQGILTSLFLGANINLGTFSNEGILSALNQTFLVTGNPVTGAGEITDNPIPAILALCDFPLPDPDPDPDLAPDPEPIPTMSQWGLFIFGLLVLNMGLYFVKQKTWIN